MTAAAGRSVRCASLSALCAVLVAAGCGAAHKPKTADGPQGPTPSLGLKYGHLLGQVPYTFLGFSKVVGHDHDPDGDLLYRQAAPVISALGAVDVALARGAAPRQIANDMAILVLADQRLLSDLEQLPGLTGSQLASWEQGFSTDGGTEQAAFNNVLHDFGLPSVGQT
jgi:hypothetical protein